MIRRLASQPVETPLPKETAPAKTKRIYSSAVVALAVFFVGLTIWRSPVVGYVVISEVEFPRAVPASLVVGEVPRTQGTKGADENSRQLIADAMRATNRQLRGDAAHDGVNDRQIRAVWQRLRVTTAGGSGKSSRMQFLYEGADVQWSLAFVDNLVRTILIAQALAPDTRPTAAREVRAAQWRVEQLRHYERKARFDLEETLSAWFEQGTDQVVRTAERSVSRTGRPAQPITTNLPPPRQLNPDWEQLSDEFTHLATEFTELLKTVTPNHPRVRDITLQMEEIRRQLESTSKFQEDTTSNFQASATGEFPISGEGAEGIWRPAAADEVTAAVATELAPEWQSAADLRADQSPYRQKRDRYEAVIQEREEAEREFGKVIAKQQSAFADRSVQAGRVARPATLLRRIGGRPSSRSVWLVGLTAIVCGAGIHWGGRDRGPGGRINTMSDLQRTLVLPVVGQISIEPVSTQRRRLLVGSRVVLWSTRAGELALAMMVLLFLMHLLLNGPASGELVDNPLGAFVNSVADAAAEWF